MAGKACTGLERSAQQIATRLTGKSERTRQLVSARTGSRAGRRPALGIRQAGGHEHGPILAVFVTASLSDPLPRSARREPFGFTPRGNCSALKSQNACSEDQKGLG